MMALHRFVTRGSDRTVNTLESNRGEQQQRGVMEALRNLFLQQHGHAKRWQPGSEQCHRTHIIAFFFVKPSKLSQEEDIKQ